MEASTNLSCRAAEFFWLPRPLDQLQSHPRELANRSHGGHSHAAPSGFIYPVARVINDAVQLSV